MKQVIQKELLVEFLSKFCIILTCEMKSLIPDPMARTAENLANFDVLRSSPDRYAIITYKFTFLLFFFLHIMQYNRFFFSTA